ncbi:MAG TPA: hypothetical protein VNO31_14090 [Umezawaea sp.]|nr:hypothetical protein [Umezawaea sp.]
MSGQHRACCDDHKAIGCCGADCSPCCLSCPSCPTVATLTATDREALGELCGLYAGAQAGVRVRVARSPWTVQEAGPEWARLAGVLS